MTCDFCNNEGVLNWTQDAFCFCSIGEEKKKLKIKQLKQLIKKTQIQIQKLEQQDHDCCLCTGSGRYYAGDDCYIDCPECG